ncbi:MAG: NAD(P)-dependent methylenetetrahydromethanopterin dehydrogenase [Methylococcales bacterium]
MAQRILYFLTPGNNISPFDVTIASDAGFDLVVPITDVAPKSVVGMVQDAIFARPPNRFNDTGIFIGGRDVHLAADMFTSAKKAMVGDFQVGVFADPNGAYTTSASIVALVQKGLEDHGSQGLAGRVVSVFGTGPVGLCTAVLAAKQGAKTRLCQLTADDDPQVAERFCERYECQVDWVSAETYNSKIEVLADTEVAISAARAGIRILNVAELEHANKLAIVADTNAVPPSGIDGVGLQDKGAVLEFPCGSVKSFGPLAIGNLKYKVQFGLYERIHTSNAAALIDFPDAFEYALSLVHNKSAL